MDIPWVQLVWHSHYSDKILHAENLCGSFWWRDVMKQIDNFRGVSAVKHGRGDTFLFWLDNWSLCGSITPMRQRFPRLFSFVLDEHMSAAEVFAAQDFSELFFRPLSIQAFHELGELQMIMQANPLSQQKDHWTYTWGEKYSPGLFYKHIHKHIQVPRVYKWLWKSCCRMTTKMFAWLLLHNRINTRDMLQRRHWKVTNDVHYELCPSRIYEDRIHLFFECCFSKRVWNYLQIECPVSDDLQRVVSEARRRFMKPFFMEVIITACWNIWLVRNDNFF
jgi:hypothetical protein